MKLLRVSENLGGTVREKCIGIEKVHRQKPKDPKKIYFFMGIFYVFSRTSPARDITSQKTKHKSWTWKSMGNELAEKTLNYRDDVLRDGPDFLGSCEWKTASECSHSYPWLCALDTVDGVGEKNIY